MVDVETTGFAPDEQRIIEVGVVLLDQTGDEVSAFCTLLDPGCAPGPTHVHGISSDMLTGAPSFGVIHPYLADQLSGRVVVGHNVADFDLAFLRAECCRLGGEGLVPGVVPTVDTLWIAQQHLGLKGRAKLVDCCDYFGLSWEDHHSALGDARVTAALFRCMWAQLGDEILGITGALERASTLTWPGASTLAPCVQVRAGSEVSIPEGPGRQTSARPVIGSSDHRGLAPRPSVELLPTRRPRRFVSLLRRAFRREHHPKEDPGFSCTPDRPLRPQSRRNAR